ncbi:hypothetical protein CK203_002025 [Vitis vinifera]|uniref:Uncharacterized protein n=1 Tax=Vitis vinifera TaxID=29760 RepID=A0A438KK90_VITVI|nr:hypothetical protein CK203_002025 [Vitis vinifera]
MRGSACVEVMTTLHGSAPSLRRRAEGCVPPEGMIASARDILKSTLIHLEPLDLVVESALEIMTSLSTVGPLIFIWMLCLFLFRLSFLLYHSPSHILIPFFVLCRIGPLFLVLIYLCGSEQRRSAFRIRIFTLSLGIVSWIRVEGRLVRVSDTPDMDQQVVTVDQFTAAMASIQEALASLRQEISGQQVHQASPYVLHGRSEIAPPAAAQAVVADDTHARMDRIEQCMRQMRVSDGSVVWDDFWGLYSTVMRAHGLDEPQMITLFPLSLSGALSADVSRRELEALRQRTEESVSSFISRWRGKIAEIVDRPSERDQIQMVLRSLQPRIARHVVGAPFTDFGVSGYGFV